MARLAKVLGVSRGPRVELLSDSNDLAWALLGEAGLSRELWFVLRLAQVALGDDLSARLMGQDLNLSQFTVLGMIKAQPGLTQQRIGDTLRIRRAKFIPLIYKLEDRGLVSRVSSSMDRRAYALRLTGSGERVLERAMEAAAAHDEITDSLLERKERDRLVHSLRKLMLNLPVSGRAKAAGAPRGARSRNAHQPLTRAAEDHAWPFMDEANVFQRIIAIRMAQRGIFEDLLGRLRALNLTVSQLATVRLINARPALTQQRIGDALRIQKTNLAPLIEELEDRSLVLRKNAPIDRRAYALYLTVKGKSILEKGMQAVDAHLAVIARILDQDESDRLVKSLGEVALKLPRTLQSLDVR